MLVAAPAPAVLRRVAPDFAIGAAFGMRRELERLSHGFRVKTAVA